MSSIEFFNQQAKQWWDMQNGPFKLLHAMNPVRLKYIIDNIRNELKADFQDISVIDIGCGGGILTIPLARLGMQVTGIDPGQDNIDIAIHHSAISELIIQYEVTALENLQYNRQYDVVTAMEVIEHVDDYKIFFIHLSKIVKPGGLLFLSTINRTFKSLTEAIFIAESVLKLVPNGTHEWLKFLKPSEILAIATTCDMKLLDIMGIKLNLCTQKWHSSTDVSINYMMCLRKNN